MAFSGGDAYTLMSTGSSTGSIKNRPFGDDVGRDDVCAEDGGQRDDDGEVHCKTSVWKISNISCLG